jgi:hypothetical protein
VIVLPVSHVFSFLSYSVFLRVSFLCLFVLLTFPLTLILQFLYNFILLYVPCIAFSHFWCPLKVPFQCSSFPACIPVHFGWFPLILFIFHSVYKPFYFHSPVIPSPIPFDFLLCFHSYFLSFMYLPFSCYVPSSPFIVLELHWFPPSFLYFLSFPLISDSYPSVVF